MGSDIEFPERRLKVEVKGCRGRIENLRVTKHEWAVAKSSGRDYVLAIVSNLDSPGNEQVALIRDPYHELSGDASRQDRLQISYTISHGSLRQHICENEAWFQQSDASDA